MALLSHPCDAAALDHLCRQEHGFLQHFSFLSQGCVQVFLAWSPALLPPPHRVSASTQRGRELSSVSQLHLSSFSQTHAPSFPRFISFVLSAVPTRRRGLWLLPRQTGDPSARLGSGCRICSRLFPSAQQHRSRLPQTGAQKCADGCAKALCW